MPQDDDFYTSISLSPETDQLDAHLEGRSIEAGHFDQLQALTDKGREANALTVPVDAGTRVAFLHNIGSVLAYPYVPEEGTKGTVIMVRTADGDTTFQGDDVFVKWDTGPFLPIHRHHLRASPDTPQRRASAFAFRVANFGDLSALFAGDKTSDLVHKSTKDLWSCEENEGEFVISRLFDDTGEPLKA